MDSQVRALRTPFFIAIALFSFSASFANAQTTDVIVALPFDEGGGTFATDVSGRGNNGLLQNGATYSQDSSNGSPYSLQLDGVNDYVDLGALTVNGTGLTLAARFKAASFTGSTRDGRLISKASGLQDYQHIFMLSTIAYGSVTRLRARVRAGGVTRTLIAASGNLQTGVWYHAALTYDGARVRLYLNGSQVGSTSLTGTVARGLSTPVAVGAQPPGAGGKYFSGLIDDARIVQRGLSASEIAALAASQSSNTTPTARDDSYTTALGTTLNVSSSNGVLSNDTDPDGSPLTAVLESTVAHGTLTLRSNGSFDYTPSTGYSGPDEFRYRASDGAALSAAARVSLTVTATSPPPNSPPTISGSPASTSTQGQLYRFVPSASDPDGDPLTFSITNAPTWATFNTATGELSGTPTASHIGTYSNITIRVADDEGASAALPAFTIEVRAPVSKSATLSWTAPTQRSDGAPLTNLAGYKIFWGTQSRVYSNSTTVANPGITTYVVENLVGGTKYYFSVKAFDAAGSESSYSAEVSRTLSQ